MTTANSNQGDGPSDGFQDAILGPMWRLTEYRLHEEYSFMKDLNNSPSRTSAGIFF